MSPKSPSKRLYLRNLPKYVNHKSLLKHLSIYGKITEVKIVHDYAFVQFESQQDAQDVVDTFRDQPFLGEDITVEFARPMRKDRRSSGSSNTADSTVSIPVKPFINIPPRPVSDYVQYRYPVVVSNIPRKIRWQELKDFGRLPGGLVAFCDLDRKHPGRGFVEYFTKEHAERAIKELDNTFLGGQRVRVSGRPENVSRGRSRSHSPLRRESSLRRRPYDGHGRSCHTSSSNPRSEMQAHGYRFSEHEHGLDRHDYDDRHRQHERSPPPAYWPRPPIPTCHHSESHREIRSPMQHSICATADPLIDRGLAKALGLGSYPTSDFIHEPQYEEQYDYASHSASLDAWKYDYDYSAGHVADPFEVPPEQTPGYQAYDSVPQFFLPI